MTTSFFLFPSPSLRDILRARMFPTHLKEAMRWISGIATKDDVVLLERKGRREYFQFLFPLQIGDAPRLLRTDEPNPTFMIKTPAISSSVGPNWITIFSSPLMDILESGRRPIDPPPLRWGISQDERERLIHIARESLERYVTTGEERFIPPPKLSSRFFLRSDLDVALWVDGHPRGSIVIENIEIARGVARAAIRASRDPRFRPIGRRELSQVCVEITLMRDLRVPLSSVERHGSEIYTDKGYFLAQGGKKGWLLPEVFNVRRFSSMPELLSMLATEKASLPPHARVKDVRVFEVDDWIGSPGQPAAPLCGAMVLQEAPNDYGLKMAHTAAEWLLRHQDEDGNFCPIVSARTDTSPTVDWVRQAFVTWALAEFALSTKRGRYRDASRRSLEAILDQLQKHPDEVKSISLTCAYLGKAALALEMHSHAELLLKRLLPLRPQDPISLSHVLGFVRRMIPAEEIGRSGVLVFEQNLRDLYRTDRARERQPELALYAELVGLFLGHDTPFARDVMEWMSSLQNTDGSFPRAGGSSFAYVRGTGKVFEILALDRDANHEALLRALTWLRRMQYDERNLFFIPPERRPALIGGFRHDDRNPDAWADAAGHVILGVARLTHLQKIHV